MTFSDKDILVASLIGSKAVEAVPRLAVVENYMEKHVGIPIPFLPFKNKVEVGSRRSEDEDDNPQADSRPNELTKWKANKSNVDGQFFPFSVKRAGTKDPFYTLPYEPLISISGKNNIVKRSIAKAPNFIGTVKEHWSQDDYSITITGMLFGSNEIGAPQNTFPREDFEKLREYCTSPTGLEVQCEPLQLLGINNIVIEDFSFPFSKGENVQAYDIKATSDFSADFLLEIKD